ncbi:hypothetical protein Gotur_032623 [Gossypium turneri]
MRGGGGSRHQQERETAVELGVKHRRFVALWNNRMARTPQMVMASDLQPSVEYIQWYSNLAKPYRLGGKSTVVPPHMQRPEAYEPVAVMGRSQRQILIPSLISYRSLSQSLSPSQIPSNHIHIRIHILIIQIWRAMTIF